MTIICKTEGIKYNSWFHTGTSNITIL